MTLFQSILKNIERAFEKDKVQIQHILDCIHLTTGVTLTDTMVRIQKTTLYINASPTIKMAIILKKELLLQKFKEENIPIYTIS